MNMGAMGGGGGGPLPTQCLGGQGGPPVPVPQQQAPIPPQVQSQQQEKLDNISKVKTLLPLLRDSLNMTLKTAAQTLHHNSLVDNGSSKGVDVAPPRFDKSLEEFYSICDQIELHLKTSIECMNQYASSQRYLSISVAPMRTEPLATGDQAAPLTYPQFLATARHQVNYAKEIHDLLMSAASTVNNPE